MRIILLRTSQLNCRRSLQDLAIMVSTKYISYYILRLFEQSSSCITDSGSKEPEKAIGDVGSATPLAQTLSKWF